ncbi:MAG: hypothetical protein FD123_1199 [Bacteroidetes bacterium]|nr:MAG: hypothetical protein FD123_1199 [Bacteroidota bacterium]
MISVERVTEIVEQKLAGTDCFLVDIQVRPGNRIAVFVDKDKGGVSISDCVSMSRYLEQALDRDVEDFELEVSSPGMDQPLRNLRQYRKRIGREVSVLLLDGRRLSGKLLDADEKKITIEEQSKQKIEGKKGRQLVVTRNEFPYEEVKETTLVITFN